MKSRRCKVEYTDNVKTSFEVKCAEIMVNDYKIYARTNETGWQLLATKKDKQKAINYANNLDSKIYNGRIVIEHDKETDTDFPINLGR